MPVFGSSSSRPRSLRLASRGMLWAVQGVALLHVLTTYIAEIRSTTGSSMLPTLAPSGDYVLHVRLPVYRFQRRVRERLDDFMASLRGESASEEEATRRSRVLREIQARKSRNSSELQLGDLVVATSPTNPSRPVCKRIVGLPGDEVLVDPRKDFSPTVTVPKGHIFLAGDNLANSTDSRHYGPIPLGLVKGVVVARVFPTRAWLGSNVEKVEMVPEE